MRQGAKSALLIMLEWLVGFCSGDAVDVNKDCFCWSGYHTSPSDVS